MPAQASFRTKPTARIAHPRESGRNYPVAARKGWSYGERRMRSSPIEGVKVRQAALVVGFTYLLSPVGYAEFTIWPKLVIPGHIDQTVANIGSHHGLFLTATFCYLINFIEDIILAWGLYILLAPVNRALALLASWFRLIYAAIALFGVFYLATVYRMLTTPDYLTLFGRGPLQAQVNLLLNSFRYDYSLALVIFGLHLLLIGYLIIRSRYIPWWLGILLIINGAGWVVDSLQPYLYPDAQLDFVFVTFFGELIFMLWLLIRGWKIQEPGVVGHRARTLI
jgi:Domain of unknown function (DUF4386)